CLLPSPHVGEDFPANAVALGLPVGLQTGGRGNDRHTEATEHVRQLGGLRIHPQAGLGHPAQTCDAALTVRAVLQLHDQVLVLVTLLGAVVRDVTLALEDLRDVLLELRVRHHDLVVISRVGIAQTRQEVCDRVGHRHDEPVNLSHLVPGWPGPVAIFESSCVTSWTCSRPAVHRGAPSRAGTPGTGRTCGTPSAACRTSGTGCRPARRTSACASPWRSVPSWPWDQFSLNGKPR